MANLASAQFESQMKSFAQGLSGAVGDAADLRAFYYASGSDALVDALAQNTTPATVSTGLIKVDIINFVGVLTEIAKLMGNQVTAQIYGQAYAEKLLEKTTVADEIVSHSVEAVGERMKALSRKLCDLYVQAVKLSAMYDAVKLGVVASGLAGTTPSSGDTVVFGSDTTANKFIDGATLLVQFKKFMNAEVTTQGDYLGVMLSWV